MKIYIFIQIDSPPVWKPYVQCEIDRNWKEQMRCSNSYGLFYLDVVWAWVEFEISVK